MLGNSYHKKISFIGYCLMIVAYTIFLVKTLNIITGLIISAFTIVGVLFIWKYCFEKPPEMVENAPKEITDTSQESKSLYEEHAPLTISIERVYGKKQNKVKKRRDKNHSIPVESGDIISFGITLANNSPNKTLNIVNLSLPIFACKKTSETEFLDIIHSSMMNVIRIPLHFDFKAENKDTINLLDDFYQKDLAIQLLPMEAQPFTLSVDSIDFRLVLFGVRVDYVDLLNNLRQSKLSRHLLLFSKEDRRTFLDTISKKDRLKTGAILDLSRLVEWFSKEESSPSEYTIDKAYINVSSDLAEWALWPSQEELLIGVMNSALELQDKNIAKRCYESAIQSKVGSIRAKAVEMLDIIDNPKDQFQSLLVDDYCEVRISVVRALRRLGTVEALSISEDRESKENDKLVKREMAVELLIQALKDKESNVRMEAAEALGEIKDTRAVEPLIQALKDKDSNVRKMATEALGNIGKPAVDLLIQALKDKDSNNIRRMAAIALGEIKDTKTVEPLIHALKDENWYVRKKSGEALGKIKDTRAVEPLIHALKDKDNHVRRIAAIALGNIGDKRAIEPLIHALKDENSVVQKTAKEAIEEIQKPK